MKNRTHLAMLRETMQILENEGYLNCCAKDIRDLQKKYRKQEDLTAKKTWQKYLQTLNANDKKELKEQMLWAAAKNPG